MFTPNSRSRPTSKVLLSRIRSIHSLLPFGPSSTGTKTSIQVRAGPSPQNTQPESSRSRHRKKSTLPTNVTDDKKATFQWVKGEPLGKGSYATVYLGLNATTGEIMAVKQVELPQSISDKLSSRHQEIADALKFENQTLRGLDHPNIVQYLGYEESARYLSIFLEYVPGGTISSCLQNHGRFSDEVTRSFTRQMLEGLEYLHCMGILHRDLKSDNILVEPSGVCKISDFGISKQAEDILQARAFTGMRGTIYWMAPEMLDNDKRKGYDVKVDIWSVGCIVLEMWTGERPWYGEEIFPVMMKLSQNKLPPPLPPDLLLSDNASAFRRQCFQINPHDRPSAAELQAHPYLVLPKSWSFDVSEIEPTPMRRSFPQTSRRSRGKSMKSNRLFSSPSVNSEDVPPGPPITTIAPYRPVDRSSELESLRPSLSDHHQRPDSRPKPDSGPPVVYITPPSSPPSQIALLSNNNSRTSLDTSGSFSTTRKGFRIINPDPEPDTEAEPFVYNPPPLPNIDLDSPYSARLSPEVVLGANEAYPAPHVTHSRASSPVNSSSRSFSIGSSRRKPATHQASQRQTTVSETSYYPDTYNDDDDEIWKKPPADLTTKGASSRRRTRPSSRNHNASEAASRASTHEEWARPVHSEVYENLQEFFPKCDLDNTVVFIGSAGSPLVDREDRKQRIKKSIRMVAEEQNRLGSRRRTKLWDSKVEELRM